MRYSNPLAAYLAGEANLLQTQIVESWAEASPDNAELLKHLERSWEENGLNLDDLPHIDNSTEESNLVED